MKKITYVGAHIDDAELWAGGTLLIHREAGDDVNIIVHDTEDLVRKAEQKVAAELGGYGVDYYSTVDQLRTQLIKLVPDIIITHWDDDSHPDHRSVAADVLEGVKDCRRKNQKPAKFYFCDTYNKVGIHGDFGPSRYIDISSVIDQKRALIKSFVSQNPEFLIDRVELMTRLYGSRCQCLQAEAFKEFSYLGSGFAESSL